MIALIISLLIVAWLTATQMLAVTGGKSKGGTGTPGITAVQRAEELADQDAQRQQKMQEMLGD